MSEQENAQQEHVGDQPGMPNKGRGSGWLERRWVRDGKSGKVYGPYLYWCWREGKKRRARYLGKAD